MIAMTTSNSIRVNARKVLTRAGIGDLKVFMVLLFVNGFTQLGAQEFRQFASLLEVNQAAEIKQGFPMKMSRSFHIAEHLDLGTCQDAVVGPLISEPRGVVAGRLAASPA